MFAILKAAEWININCKFETIYILSDSQASLAALNKQQTNSALILQTIKELNKVGLNNNIYLIKVPAHIGIQGNEQADKLAKLATTVTSTIHKLKISMSHIIKEMKEKLHKEHINRVSKSKISEKAKLPMIEI